MTAAKLWGKNSHLRAESERLESPKFNNNKKKTFIEQVSEL